MRLKRVCQVCPVRIACLAWAVGLGITLGVWGAATENERRALRRPEGSDNRSSLARCSAGGLNHNNQVMPAHYGAPQPGHADKPALEEARCEHSNTTSSDASVCTQ